MEIVLSFFLVLIAAVVGGFIAKYLKAPVLVGYIIGGLIFGSVLPTTAKDVTSLSEIGTILLLFSIGLELSFDRLSKFLKISLLGAILQMFLVTVIFYFILTLIGIDQLTSFILSFGFSLSSTAVVIKMLSDKGELETIHGEIMFGWLLVQDLAVIPMMILLPILAQGVSDGSVATILFSLFKSLLVLTVAIVLGRKVVPFIIHQVSGTNSRELLVLTSVALAFGTATFTSYIGISASIGAFLAGIVISETYEHHAVFAETRALKDLFVALFFVSLGFLVDPQVVFSNLVLILGLIFSIVIVKIIVTHFITSWLSFKGKTAFATAFGLSQVGEFAFVIYSVAGVLGIISQESASIGIAVTLGTLVLTPFLYRNVLNAWRKVKDLTQNYPLINKFFSAQSKKLFSDQVFENHIIICGYGRVGSWIGKALKDFQISYVIVEFNQKVIDSLSDIDAPVLYGDPSEPELLEQANIKSAKALILAIPDSSVQQNLIAYVQTVAPNVKILSRAHEQRDIEKLKLLKIDRIVQPEFEAALAITKSILVTLGVDRTKIANSIRGLRVSQGIKFSKI